MCQRDRHAIPRVDDAVLEAGRSPTALNTSFCSNVFLICLYISFTHPSHPDGGQRALFLRVFYRFFTLLEINLSLCQTNGVSYFIGS